MMYQAISRDVEASVLSRDVQMRALSRYHGVNQGIVCAGLAMGTVLFIFIMLMMNHKLPGGYNSVTYCPDHNTTYCPLLPWNQSCCAYECSLVAPCSASKFQESYTKLLQNLVVLGLVASMLSTAAACALCRIDRNDNWISVCSAYMVVYLILTVIVCK